MIKTWRARAEVELVSGDYEARAHGQDFWPLRETELLLGKSSTRWQIASMCEFVDAELKIFRTHSVRWTYSTKIQGCQIYSRNPIWGCVGSCQVPTWILQKIYSTHRITLYNLCVAQGTGRPSEQLCKYWNLCQIIEYHFPVHCCGRCMVVGVLFSC